MGAGVVCAIVLLALTARLAVAASALGRERAMLSEVATQARRLAAAPRSQGPTHRR